MLIICWSFLGRGYETTIIMPDDVALEKVKVAEMLGATVERVRPGKPEQKLLGRIGNPAPNVLK
jgi:cysteine synthase